jgi:hypothetical protein
MLYKLEGRVLVVGVQAVADVPALTSLRNGKGLALGHRLEDADLFPQVELVRRVPDEEGYLS